MKKDGNSTLRSMVISLIGVIICAAMLAATTFAWFTESIGSAGNAIVGGNMDFALFCVCDNAETPLTVQYDGRDYTVKNPSVLFSAEARQPGDSFKATLRVKNTGTLPICLRITVGPERYVSGDSVLASSPRIEAGAYADYSLQFTIPDKEPSGTVNLTVQIDAFSIGG